MAEQRDRPLPADAEVRRDPVLGTIQFLKGDALSADMEDDAAFREHQAQGRFDQLALAFVAAHRSAFRLDRPERELGVLSVTTDDLGLTHVKLQQTFEDLPVEAAQLIVHLNESSQVYLVNGRYLPTPSGLSTAPALQADQARSVVAQELELDDACRDCPSDLVIFAPNEDPPRLAYRVRANVSIAEGWQFMVDAQNGAVLQKLPTVIHGDRSGTLAPRKP